MPPAQAVGKALVVAADRPRAELLRDASRDALVVLLGCLPWILLLGFVEGYLSPSQAFGVPFKAATGLLLEALFLTVAWNPLARRGTAAAESAAPGKGAP